ncbi:helical backbone metal receptor [Ideonella sp. DXS29W]|uniref:Helical backbone metal receptor n=1 Tax=Ideonella lacteola TaxID=2984193 RepID=A0ABU9BJC4_9BURK
MNPPRWDRRGFFSHVATGFIAWLVGCLLACLMVSWWPSTAAAATSIVLRDDAGAEHRLAAPPQRIITLLPSLTEAVSALGGTARLVGVDRYSNWPESIQHLPRLGGLEDAQVERIVALKPDVVLAAKSARVTERLQALGLRVVLLESQTHADVRRTLGLVAQLLGTPAAGERAWAEIEAQFARAASRVPPAARGRKVYFEVATDPYAAGASSFIGETLVRLGLGNVVPAEMGPFPRLNPEFVVRAQPDIVMTSKTSLDTMAERPGWAAMTAFQSTPPRACGFATARYELLIRPGPRMGEAALALADCVAGLSWPGGSP